jgi:hypothetical protein
MRTKATFTEQEKNEIIKLIEQKLKADTQRQKTIRAKIRKLGFWASDFDFKPGYTVNDFLGVAKIENK